MPQLGLLPDPSAASAAAGRGGRVHGSAGNLLLLLSQRQQQAPPAVGDAVAEGPAGAPSLPRRSLARTFGSQPTLQLFRHPQDFGVEVHHAGQDEPLPMGGSRATSLACGAGDLPHLAVSSHPQAGALQPDDHDRDGPDALGIILLAGSHVEGTSTGTAVRSSNSSSDGGAAAAPAAGSAAPVDAGTPLPSSLVEALPDDVLRSILMMMDPMHRHAASAACDKLLALAQPTFKSMALALPPLPLHAVGSQAAAQAPAALKQTLAALPASRFDSITRLELVLPVTWDRRQLRTLEEPCAPLNAWLGCYLSTGHAAQSLESLALTSIHLPPPTSPGHLSGLADHLGGSAALFGARSVGTLLGGPLSASSFSLMPSCSAAIAMGHGKAAAAAAAAPRTGRRSLDASTCLGGAGGSTRVAAAAGGAARPQSHLHRSTRGGAAWWGQDQATQASNGARCAGAAAVVEDEGGDEVEVPSPPVDSEAGSEDDEVAGPLDMDSDDDEEGGKGPAARSSPMPVPAASTTPPPLCSSHSSSSSSSSSSSGASASKVSGAWGGELLPRERGAFISGRALHLLAAQCPSLKHLSVPLLALSAAPALPALAGQLTHFSCAIQDSTLLDAVFQLRALTSLRLSLHTNLLSCMLNQSQLATLARQVQGLRSLWLSGLLLPDTDAAWRCLGALTALTELRVSAPFHARHLEHVPHLRMLQLPTFSEGGATLQHLADHVPHLHELRCRLSLCVSGALALRRLAAITSLQLDSVTQVAEEVEAWAGRAAAPAPAAGAVPAAPAAAAAEQAAQQQQQLQQPPADGLVLAAAVAGAAHHVWGQGAGGAGIPPAGNGVPPPPPPPPAAPVVAPPPAQDQPPALPQSLLSLFVGLEVPSVTSLVLTGVYTYRGELGALFPNLTSCAIAAVRLPAGPPCPAAPLPRLERLAWPACTALPQVLLGAPCLTSLTVTAVTGAHALLQALVLPGQGQGEAATQGGATGGAAAGGAVRPGSRPATRGAGASTHSHSHSHPHPHPHHAQRSSSARRSSRSGHADEAGTESLSEGAAASHLSAGDAMEGHQQVWPPAGAAAPPAAATVACRLQHLALVLQGETPAPVSHHYHHHHSHGHGTTNSHHQQSKALRSALATVLSMPLCASLQSLTLRDLAPSPAPLSSLSSSSPGAAPAQGGPSSMAGSTHTSSGGGTAPISFVASAATSGPAGVRGLLLPRLSPHQHLAAQLHPSPSLLAEVDEDEEDREGADLVLSPSNASLRGGAGARGRGSIMSALAAAAVAAASSGPTATAAVAANTRGLAASSCSSGTRQLRATRSSSGTPALAGEVFAPHTAQHEGAPHAVDVAALQACGRLVDEGVLGVVLSAGSGRLRSLRVTSAGGLTCTGLANAMRTSSTPHLEHLVLTGCPRVRQGSAEQLSVGRPWLNVTWAP